MALVSDQMQQSTALPSVSYVALMVSRRCNMSCGHCSVESSPHVKQEPTEAELLDSVRQVAATGVKALQITGGEPMLREALVLRLVRECRQHGLFTFLSTNGFWGKSLTDARRRVKALRDAGLKRITVSYDRYHREFQGAQPLQHIAQAAEELDLALNVNVVRVANDPEIAQLVAPFAEFRHLHRRFYDVQPVGRARQLAAESLRSEVEGFCAAAAAPAITDDGRVIACNGPAYFAGPESPLHIGSLRTEPFSTLLARHQHDPVLDTIRTFGPTRLRAELQKIPEFDTFPWRSQYYGLCDLCQHITSHSGAVHALRSALAHPQAVAARVAARRVIEGNRRKGALSWRYVNGIGVARLFFQALCHQEGEWSSEAESLLGRADLDWGHLAAYLTACGLSRPLLSVLKHPAVTRWTPRFFVERVQTQAFRDGLRELVQREALRRLAIVLHELGGTGVLLKGGALVAMTEEKGITTPQRATGDLDVYIDAPLASRVRQRLLETGWTGAQDDPRTATHHLAAVSFQGIPLEIHTRIMPVFWGLPEQDLLAHSLPLQTLAPLRILNPEGFLLHAGMHTATTLFSLGLKTAWDFVWGRQHFGEIDWNRLARWVNTSRLARGFWVPARVLCRELAIPFSSACLAQSPNDPRQQRLETIAHHRLFSEFEGPLELNLFSRHAVVLMLHESWSGRVGYLATAARGTLEKAHHNGGHVGTTRTLSGLPQQFRQAWRHWQRYRHVRTDTKGW